jgi:regulator of protease activity HflC (stomatin/prohibitin superfamily)
MATVQLVSREKVVLPKSGWTMLGTVIGLFLSAILFFVLTGALNAPGYLWLAFPCLIAAIFCAAGFLVLQPNQAAVLLLFGEYRATVRESGFFWANPFLTKRRITLRLQNLNVERIKVNDKAGNPIEIAAIVVWRVADTYAASFEVENYADYVRLQSESALRHLASSYPYDSWEIEAEITLRGNMDEVAATLVTELQLRLQEAGVVVIEARLSHLAYAPEIAEAMLRRQQASAVVAARQKIVEGGVGMVRMALEMLSAEHIVELDDERKAAMVSNLLVVLCGETAAQPVVNTGTLYH